MSGVHVGTRLDQLVVLRDHVLAEIEKERRAGWANGQGIRTTPEPAVALMNTLGVTSREVKAWAVDAGLLTAVRRGRVSLTIVKAYQEANHQT